MRFVADKWRRIDTRLYLALGFAVFLTLVSGAVDSSLEGLPSSAGISPRQTTCNPRRVERCGTPGAQQLAR